MSIAYTKDLLYLPYLFLYLALFYVAVGLLCFHLFDRKHYFNKYSSHQRNAQRCCGIALCDALPCTSAFSCGCQSLAFPLARFETIFESIFEGRLGSVALLLLRGAAALYVAYFNYQRYDEHTLYQYDAWANAAALIYLALAAIASGVSAVRWLPEQQHRWSLAAERLGSWLIVFKAIALGNAVFLLAASYLVTLPAAPSEVHLVPALVLLAEQTLSKMPVRLEHYLYPLGLLVAYILFTWVRVAGHGAAWPTVFLQVDAPSCFARYSEMLGLHCGLYLALVGLNTCKERCLGLRYQDTTHIPQYASLALNTAHDNQFSYEDDDRYRDGEEEKDLEMLELGLALDSRSLGSPREGLALTTVTSTSTLSP